MPKELDVNGGDADLQSSAQVTPDVAPAQADGDAQSSSATDVAESPTLSIVRDVVAKEAEADPQGSSPDADEDGAQAADPEAQDQPDTTEAPAEAEDDEAKYPKRAQKRIRELVEEKKTLEVEATRYRNVETFLRDNGLAPDEAADGLQIMALAKTNPVEAWERIKPWVEKVAVAAGVIMPSDLQQQVQQGQMTRDVALELSKSRAKLGAVEAQRQFEQQRSQEQAVVAYQQAIVGAASTWEQDRRVKDPNFDAKLPALQREIAYLHATEGRPNTPEGVKDQCERAYKAVNTQVRGAVATPAPARRAVAPIGGGQVAGNPAPRPESTLDIIRANRLRA